MSDSPKVLNGHHPEVDRHDPNNVYVGRPSKWGNPFNLTDHSREDAVSAYFNHINRRPDLLSSLSELKGKNLICWCAPLECHADILLRLANEEDNVRE